MPFRPRTELWPQRLEVRVCVGKGTLLPGPTSQRRQPVIGFLDG